MLSDNQYNSTDVPKTINDNATITSTISITDNTCCIDDINVGITLTHSWDKDLDIYLISPDGTRVELSTDNGGTGDNYTSTIFDDEAAISIELGSAPFTGSFVPEGSLATLDDESFTGTWTLEITDDELIVEGELTGWYIEITLPPPIPTLSEWGRIVFIILLLLSGMVRCESKFCK